MSSTTEKMSLSDVAMEMTYLKFLVTAFPVIIEILFHLKELNAGCPTYVGPLIPALTGILALTALSMTFLVVEFFGLPFKIYGIIEFVCHLYRVVLGYFLGSWLIAEQPLKG